MIFSYSVDLLKLTFVVFLVCRRVQHLMGAIAMRRTKNQMVDGKPIVELPARNVFVEHVKLSEEERSLYEAMQNEGKIIVSR